jgi:hypothetical protein
MTLTRMIVVFLGGLAVLLWIVVLRAETTRLHYEISGYEDRAETYRQRLRQVELELAQYRNPLLLRERVERVLEQLRTADPPDDPAEP